MAIAFNVDLNDWSNMEIITLFLKEQTSFMFRSASEKAIAANGFFRFAVISLRKQSRRELEN